MPTLRVGCLRHRLDEADTSSAERAFEALRAGVAVLRQAVEGQTAPDYALTLGAIVRELRVVGARLDAIEAAPPMQVTPAVIAQQIRDEAVRLVDSHARQAQAAREGFERGQDTLARVAFFQQRADRDRNILWAVGGGAALIGAVLGTMLFMEITRHAPNDWGWSAGCTAWLMQANTLQAGYRVVTAAACRRDRHAAVRTAGVRAWSRFGGGPGVGRVIPSL
ncbi:MAG TPA: DUF6118 family protein [Acetobacteraceae bacterium]|nr:DUF6118 family protein [Acetobacteraceae bacterium]